MIKSGPIVRAERLIWILSFGLGLLCLGLNLDRGTYVCGHHPSALLTSRSVARCCPHAGDGENFQTCMKPGKPKEEDVGVVVRDP